MPITKEQEQKTQEMFDSQVKRVQELPQKDQPIIAAIMAAQTSLTLESTKLLIEIMQETLDLESAFNASNLPGDLIAP